MKAKLKKTLAAAGVLVLSSLPTTAQTPEEFYSGKTVTVVSPSGTGGSIYQYALLVSNHIGRHIPGKPDAVVEDRGGGGGVKAANYVFSAAPDDGLVIAELHPSSLVVPLTRDVKYNFAEANWLGSVAVRPYVGAAWHSVDVDRIEDIGDGEVIYAASGVGGSSYQYPVFVARMSGANIKVIPGYKSGGAMNLAMERGEVQGRGNYYEGFLATNPDWVEQKKIKFLFRMGDDHPDLMEVPLASSYAKTDQDRAMLGLLEAPLKVGQAFYTQPNVPEDRVAALRKAFTDMLADPDFKAEAEKLNLVVRTRTADEVEANVKAVYDTPKELASELEAIFRN